MLLLCGRYGISSFWRGIWVALLQSNQMFVARMHLIKHPLKRLIIGRLESEKLIGAEDKAAAIGQRIR